MSDKLALELIRDGAAFLVFLVVTTGPATLVLKKILAQQDTLILRIGEKLDKLVETTAVGMRETAAALSAENEAHRDTDHKRHLELLREIHAVRLGCALTSRDRQERVRELVVGGSRDPANG